MAVSTIPNNRPIFEGRTSAAFNVSANGTASMSIDCAKQGYTVLGFAHVDSSSNDVDVMKFSMAGNTAYVRVWNISSSALSNITMTIRVLYIPT